MQTTASRVWREMHSLEVLPAGIHNTGISNVEITIAITDPRIQDNYTATSTDQMPFSDLAQAAYREPENIGRYATGEAGSWPLDGATIPFGSYQDNFGFVSRSLSSANGRFAQPIVISLQFNFVLLQSIPGMQIVWSEAFGEMAREVTLTAFLHNNVIRQQTFRLEPEVESIIEFPISNYNRIDIAINEWCLPHTRARIERIHIGFFMRFRNQHITEMYHHNSADPLGSFIPENTLTFTIDNREQRWNPVNPQGLYRFLLERQEMVLRYGLELSGRIEWIPGGVFYLSSWRMPQHGITATFTGFNTFSLLDEEYEGVLSGTLYDIAESALIQADLPPVPRNFDRWVLSDVLKNHSHVVTQPRTDTIKNILQMCAHAASCAMWQDRNGTIHIEPITWQTGFKLQSNSGSAFSDLSQLAEADGKFSKVATGETGIWRLDGEMGTFTFSRTFPFVSQSFANANGIFSIPPKITATTPGNQRYTPLVRIIWSKTHNEVARRFRVNVIHNGQIISTTNIENNTELENRVFTNANIFDIIEVEILEWAIPYHRARVEHLYISPDYIIDRRNSQQSADVEVMKELRRINVNRGLAVIEHSNIGEILDINNPLVTTAPHAMQLAEHVRNWVINRNIYTGDFAADPRLDPLDIVLIINLWAMRFAVCKNIDYGFFGGRVWGYYEAREIV